MLLWLRKDPEANAKNLSVQLVRSPNPVQRCLSTDAAAQGEGLVWCHGQDTGPRFLNELTLEEADDEKRVPVGVGTRGWKLGSIPW